MSAACPASREPEVDGAVEPAGTDERRIEVVLAIRCPHHQDVGRHHCRLAQLSAVGEVTVHHVDPRRCHTLAPCRRVERLELDQQLVDHTGHALTGPVAEPPAGRPDGVDLLDEPDGAAFPACVLPELLEERPDLAIGLPVVHRLEGRRGDEEERDVGLLGHRLGHKRLAGPRRTLEEDAAPGRAAHGVAEGLVSQEEVDGTDHLRLDGVDPHQVLEADGGLTRADQGVRRAARADEGGQHDYSEHQDDDEGGEHAGRPVGQVKARHDPVTRRRADRDPARDERAAADESQEAGHATSLPQAGHVGRTPQDRVSDDPRDRRPRRRPSGLHAPGPPRIRLRVRTRGIRHALGRSATHDLTPFIPRGRFPMQHSQTSPVLRSAESNKCRLVRGYRPRLPGQSGRYQPPAARLPPSTWSVVPVTKRARSLARKTMAPAPSRGVPQCPSGGLEGMA